MSAWRIGVEGASRSSGWRGAAPETGSPAGQDGDQRQQLPFTKEFDRLKKWIPAETLAVYVPAVALVSAGSGKSSLPLLILMLAATPIIVIVAAASKGGVGLRAVVSAILALVAFAIWSVSVPLSGWGQLDVVSKNTTMVVIVAVLAGIIFSYAAEASINRLPKG